MSPIDGQTLPEKWQEQGRNHHNTAATPRGELAIARKVDTDTM